MYQSILDILNQKGIELKPGQIIWFQPWDPQGGSDLGRFFGDYIKSRYVNNPYGIRYQLVETEAPNSKLRGKMVARRFNIGSLGKNNILVGDDINNMVDVLSDVSSVDDRPVVDISKKRPSSSHASRNNIAGKFFSRLRAFMEIPLPDMEDETDNLDKSCELCDHSIVEEEEECILPKRELEETEPLVLHSIRPSKRSMEMRHSKLSKPDNTEDVKDDKEVETLEKAKEELVKRLTAVIVDYVNTTHQMPPMEEVYELVKGKIVLTPTGLSRLVVNEQLKIYLPDYNELEVSFRPLPLTIYILFLRHLDGIILNYIGDYERELEEIYSIVMPNRDEKNASKSIKSLTDTLSGSLNQKIAIIKRTFKANILNDEMAAKYYISGSRGNVYKIALPKELIQLPAVFNLN